MAIHDDLTRRSSRMCKYSTASLSLIRLLSKSKLFSPPGVVWRLNLAVLCVQQWTWFWWLIAIPAPTLSATHHRDKSSLLILFEVSRTYGNCPSSPGTPIQRCFVRLRQICKKTDHLSVFTWRVFQIIVFKSLCACVLGKVKSEPEIGLVIDLDVSISKL